MTVAAKVEIYVSRRPYLKRALSEGLINYTQLARKMVREEEIESLEAAKAALSRLEDHLSQTSERRREEVMEVAEQTGIKLQDGVRVDKSASLDPESVISAKTENGFTNILKGGDKALVTLISPIKLENTPGFVEYIVSSLSAENVNIDQLISCREDTHFVVDGEDASRTLELLRERLG